MTTSVPSLVCPLCSSTQIISHGFSGLNIIFKCKNCNQVFRDSTSLELDLIQAEKPRNEFK